MPVSRSRLRTPTFRRIFNCMSETHGRRLLCAQGPSATLESYALPVPDAIGAYVDRVCALPGVKAWVDGALAEHDFLDFEEPYRLHR